VLGASHVGNTGSSPVGTTKYNIKGLGAILSPDFFLVKVVSGRISRLQHKNKARQGINRRAGMDAVRSIFRLTSSCCLVLRDIAGLIPQGGPYLPPWRTPGGHPHPPGRSGFLLKESTPSRPFNLLQEDFQLAVN